MSLDVQIPLNKLTALRGLKLMLKLVEIEESDLETLRHWRMLPEVTKYMFTEPQLTIEMQNEWFQAINHDPTCRYWIVELEYTKIGSVYLTNIDYQNSRCSWGYYLDPSIRGQGFGKLLEYNIFDFVFNELGLNKLTSEVLAFNKRVVHIKTKCGSLIEGVLRQQIKKGKTYHDVLVMGILKDEWLEHRTKINYEKIHIECSIN
ncbi:MAG: UDP-4-amino-4,6-dideoxy-N-acetyl-beta-L-altrosamine N-acetyltransferase [Desulfosporosinus sp.]